MVTKQERKAFYDGVYMTKQVVKATVWMVRIKNTTRTPKDMERMGLRVGALCEVGYPDNDWGPTFLSAWTDVTQGSTPTAYLQQSGVEDHVQKLNAHYSGVTFEVVAFEEKLA